MPKSLQAGFKFQWCFRLWFCYLALQYSLCFFSWSPKWATVMPSTHSILESLLDLWLAHNATIHFWQWTERNTLSTHSAYWTAFCLLWIAIQDTEVRLWLSGHLSPSFSHKVLVPFAPPMMERGLRWADSRCIIWVWERVQYCLFSFGDGKHKDGPFHMWNSLGAG